ncbi:MAG: lysine exporter LysO family protein [Bacteroidales bacterium]
MIGTLLITFVLLGGILLGYFRILPEFLIHTDWSMWVLFTLLFFVGISVGSDNELSSKLRNQSPVLLLIPLITIIGSLIGVLLIVPLLPERTISDCLAVGSGFGYYSLSSILISEYKGSDLGVVALMSNIIREVTVLVFAPLLVRYFGKLAPICCAGATSMDSTLPVIIKNTGSEFVIIALIHGILVDFSVPFLVGFFCSFN